MTHAGSFKAYDDFYIWKVPWLEMESLLLERWWHRIDPVNSEIKRVGFFYTVVDKISDVYYSTSLSIKRHANT